MTTVLAEIQFSSATVGTQVFHPVGFFFVRICQIEANDKSSMCDACYWSNKIAQVNVGFLLCTFIWQRAESSMETRKKVSKYFASSDHPEKDLWTSLLSPFIFSTFELLSIKIYAYKFAYKYIFLVQNAAELQGIVSWLSYASFLAVKKTFKVEQSYMSVKQAKIDTFGFQKLIPYTLYVLGCLLKINSFSVISQFEN